MSNIEVEVEINERVKVSVDLYDVVQGINAYKLVHRWNYVAQILNKIELDVSDLTDSQKEVIKTYLTNKLALFQ